MFCHSVHKGQNLKGGWGQYLYVYPNKSTHVISISVITFKLQHFPCILMIVPIVKSTEVMLSAVADTVILAECYLVKIEGTQILRLKCATWRPTLQEV